jgi:hypothetical protein
MGRWAYGLEEIRQLALHLGLAAMVKNPLEDQQRPRRPSVPAPAPVDLGPTTHGVAVWGGSGAAALSLRWRRPRQTDWSGFRREAQIDIFFLVAALRRAAPAVPPWPRASVQRGEARRQDCTPPAELNAALGVDDGEGLGRTNEGVVRGWKRDAGNWRNYRRIFGSILGFPGVVRVLQPCPLNFFRFLQRRLKGNHACVGLKLGFLPKIFSVNDFSLWERGLTYQPSHHL